MGREEDVFVENKRVILGVLIAAGFGSLIAYNAGALDGLLQDRASRFANECLEQHRYILKNPESAYVEDAFFVDSEKERLMVEARAKSESGSYEEVTVECAVIGDFVTRGPSRDWEEFNDRTQ